MNNFQQQLENELWEYFGSMVLATTKKEMDVVVAEAQARINALLEEAMPKEPTTKGGIFAWELQGSEGYLDGFNAALAETRTALGLEEEQHGSI